MKSTLQTFSQQTVLHGFSFITNSQSLFQRCLYAVLILISITMMIRDAISLVQQFNSEPTKIELFIKHNETFDLGQPTICFVPTSFEGYDGTLSTFDGRIFQFDEEKRQMRRWENTFNRSFTLFDNWLAKYSYNISSICNQLQQWNDTDWTNFYVENNDDVEAHALIYQTVASILTTEYKLLRNNTDPYFTALDQSETVRQYLIHKRLNFAEIRTLTALIACRKSNIHVKLMSGYLNFCQTAELTWAGITDVAFEEDLSPKFCFKFPEVWKFQNTVDSIGLFFYGLVNTVKRDPAHMISIYLNFAGERAYFHSYSQSSAIKISNNQLRVKVNINSEFSSYNLARKPCTSGGRFKCILQCEQNYFLKNCNCFPLSIMTERSKPENMSYCAELPLLTLNDSLQNDSSIKTRLLASCKSQTDSINLCASHCGNECTVRQLGILMSESGSATRGVSVAVLVSSFVYPSFVESLLLRWSDVLMTFGGSIGFW